MGKHASERMGTNDMYLTCVCGWEGIVFYTTRRPEYCCDACKSKAYRQRKSVKEKANGDTNPKRKRKWSKVGTSYLEFQIARHLSLEHYEAAQALFDLARDVGAPVDKAVIKELQRRQT